MEDDEPTPSLAPSQPKYKRRKVSAVREFPKGFTRLPIETDLRPKRDEVCQSKRDSLEPVEHHQTSAHYRAESLRRERIVDLQADKVLQSGLKKKCPGNKDVFSQAETPISQNFGDLPSLVHQTVCSVGSGEEEQKLKFEQEAIRQQSIYNDEVSAQKEMPECAQVNNSSSSGYQKLNMHCNLPKRGKVSANRDFPPKLERLTGKHCTAMSTRDSDGTAKTLRVTGDGYGKYEFAVQAPEMGDHDVKISDNRETNKFTQHAENWRQKTYLITDGKDLNSDMTLPPALEEAELTNQLAILEHSSSDIIGSTEDSNLQELKYGIDDGQCDGQCELLDGPYLVTEKVELDQPGYKPNTSEICHVTYWKGHNASALNDLPEATPQLNAPDYMVFKTLESGEADDNFFGNWHRSFELDDDVELSKFNSQYAQQEVSKENLTGCELGILDLAMNGIAGSGEYRKLLKLYNTKTEESRGKKLSLIKKQYEDASRSFPQRKLSHDPSSIRSRQIKRVPDKTECKRARAFFKKLGGPASRDMKGDVQAKGARGEFSKLEQGKNIVGKVKFIPETEAREALEKGNNCLSIKNELKIIVKKSDAEKFTKSVVVQASAKQAERVVVQGLMAAPRSPWQHSKRRSGIMDKWC